LDDFEAEVVTEEEDLTEWMEAASAAADVSGTGAVEAASSVFSALASSAAVATETRTPADLRKDNISDNGLTLQEKGGVKKLNEKSS